MQQLPELGYNLTFCEPPVPAASLPRASCQPAPCQLPACPVPICAAKIVNPLYNNPSPTTHSHQAPKIENKKGDIPERIFEIWFGRFWHLLIGLLINLTKWYHDWKDLFSASHFYTSKFEGNTIMNKQLMWMKDAVVSTSCLPLMILY